MRNPSWSIFGRNGAARVTCWPPQSRKLRTTTRGKLKVTKLNVDEAMNSAGRYNIRGIPTLLVFKNGQVVEQIVIEWLDAKQSGDARAIRAALSAYDEALGIGTDAAEWWSGAGPFAEAHSSGVPLTHDVLRDEILGPTARRAAGASSTPRSRMPSCVPSQSTPVADQQRHTPFSDATSWSW